MRQSGAGELVDRRQPLIIISWAGEGGHGDTWLWASDGRIR